MFRLTASAQQQRAALESGDVKEALKLLDELKNGRGESRLGGGYVRTKQRATINSSRRWKEPKRAVCVRPVRCCGSLPELRHRPG